MNTLLLAVLLPLFGFLINGIIHLFMRSRSALAGPIATAAMLGSFVLMAYTIMSKLSAFPFQGVYVLSLLEWLRFDGLSLNLSFKLDGLSAVFSLVITGVGSLIHLYSVSYMSHDETQPRYFAYLNLFCFMMLTLVLGSSLPVVFFGWEGVGLCSYLLIGYWHDDVAKVQAGQKAFIMNRIGDLAFLLAMFFAVIHANSLEMDALIAHAWSPVAATIFGALIFFACTGKSAQLPLFTWLPDAMAGPTPVSALIHAATMVTSGIYLLARLSPVISSSDFVMNLIAIVGGSTAVLAGTVACAQSDIKKVLAYSTVSQLGLMFLAVGSGAFETGVFHVVTHAFFKALLFLGAGSVIHALHEEQNIFKMGGLRTKLPITFWTFALGWAAILGLPPTSGFFSKDQIVIQSLYGSNGNIIYFSMAIATTLLTAFYMTRMFVLVFFGKSRLEKSVEKNLHESPMVITAPLIILGFFSLVGGAWGKPVSLPVLDASHHGLLPVVAALGAALLGAVIGYKKYSQFRGTENVSEFLYKSWKIDNLYQFFFINGFKKTASWLTAFEEKCIQRTLRGSALLVEFSGSLARSLQSGSIQSYLFVLIVFAVVILWAVSFGVLKNGI